MGGSNAEYVPADDEARAFYHRGFPGGLPRDWLNFALAQTDLRKVKLNALMAFLGVCGSLHVDKQGRPTDYRECWLCKGRPGLDSVNAAPTGGPDA